MTATLPGLREHHAGDGCPTDDVEHWHALYRALDAELHAVEGELRRTNDTLNRHLSTEERDRRETVSGTERRTWEALTGYAYGTVLQAAREPLYNLVLAVRGLPDNPTAHQLTGARQAAVILQDTVLANSDTRRDEVIDHLNRLRLAVRLAGEWLHGGYGSTGQRCVCLGCELTRLVDRHMTEEETR
jgi:hypothetical protein